MTTNPLASHLLSPNDQATLARHPQRQALLGYLLARVGDWSTTLALIVVAYLMTGELSAIALLILVQVSGRAIAMRVPLDQLRHRAAILQILRLLATGALALTALGDTFWPLLPLLALLAFSSASLEQVLLNSGSFIGDRRQIPTMNRLLGRAEQSGAIIAAVLATLLLFALNESSLLFVAVGSYALAALLIKESWPGNSRPRDKTLPASSRPWEQFAAIGRAIQTVVVGLFTVAVVGTALRITLIDVVVADFSESGATYAILVGGLMAGALLGPLHVPKLLGHFPIQMIVTGATLAVTFAAIVIVISPSLLLVLPLIFVSGLILHTLDLCSGVTLRLLSRDQSHVATSALAGQAVTAGQIIALLVILLLALRFDAIAIMTTIGLSCALIIGGCFIATGGIPLTVSEIRRILRRPANQ